jgi:hypothetical protein
MPAPAQRHRPNLGARPGGACLHCWGWIARHSARVRLGLQAGNGRRIISAALIRTTRANRPKQGPSHQAQDHATRAPRNHKPSPEQTWHDIGVTVNNRPPHRRTPGGPAFAWWNWITRHWHGYALRHHRHPAGKLGMDRRHGRTSPRATDYRHGQSPTAEPSSPTPAANRTPPATAKKSRGATSIQAKNEEKTPQAPARNFRRT